MPHIVAFHLDLHCLPKQTLRCPFYRGLMAKSLKILNMKTIKESQKLSGGVYTVKGLIHFVCRLFGVSVRFTIWQFQCMPCCVFVF